jgi:hypothetical protein
MTDSTPVRSTTPVVENLGIDVVPAVAAPPTNRLKRLKYSSFSSQ